MDGEQLSVSGGIIESRTPTPGSLSADDRDPRQPLERDVEKEFEVFPRKNAIESIP